MRADDLIDQILEGNALSQSLAKLRQRGRPKRRWHGAYRWHDGHTSHHRRRRKKWESWDEHPLNPQAFSGKAIARMEGSLDRIENSGVFRRPHNEPEEPKSPRKAEYY
jgi:hypothetical protein